MRRGTTKERHHHDPPTHLHQAPRRDRLRRDGRLQPCRVCARCGRHAVAIARRAGTPGSLSIARTPAGLACHGACGGSMLLVSEPGAGRTCCAVVTECPLLHFTASTRPTSGPGTSTMATGSTRYAHSCVGVRVICRTRCCGAGCGACGRGLLIAGISSRSHKAGLVQWLAVYCGL